MPKFTVTDQEWTQITSGETFGSYYSESSGMIITQAAALPTTEIADVVIMDEANRKATPYGGLGGQHLYARMRQGVAEIHVTKGA